MNNLKVLEKLSPEKWTVVHGQCLSVGVGGFTLGGGVNMVGSTAKYGAAMEQVLSFEAFKLMLHPFYLNLKIFPKFTMNSFLMVMFLSDTSWYDFNI